MPGKSAPRSLADQLRSWPDQQLTVLLTARPDLAHPAPQDSAQLASRASTRASVLRALDRLTRLELAVLDALVARGNRSDLDGLTATVHAAPDRVRETVTRLRDLALIWGEEEDLRVVSAVGESLGTTVSGLGPPLEQLLQNYGPERVARLLADLGGTSSGNRTDDIATISTVLADPGRVAALVGACEGAARAMLDHLERTGSEGTSEHARTPADLGAARTPVEQLVARGLLVARDGRHLAVPREVALALRGGRTTHEEVGEPPPLSTSARGARLVDQAAAGAAYETVHRVELLLDHWSNHPPAALRAGGLSVRDLKATAVLLHCDERTAALLIEVVSAAELLAQGPSDTHDAAWLPTDAYDAWRAHPAAQRWSRLAEAWLLSPRLVGVVGSRVQGKGVNALAPDLERPWLVDTRLGTLRELATLPPGEVLAAGTGVASLVARLRWLRPRRPVTRDEAVGWVVEEAAALGVVGLGGLCAHGRALITEGETAAAKVVAPLLPTPVDHVLLQADLTAVAPGPLEESLARDLAVVADVESRGGATVYRFTETSIRHAFDLGWSSVEVRETISRASRTPMPQPLEYLIDDVARTFGTVRLGTAEAFLRSDDETALAALMHDPAAASLRLRRIAPTVLVSDTPADILLPRLRDLGLAPVVEGPDGLVRVARRDAHRARNPRRHGPGTLAELEVRAAARAAATVTAVRAGDRAAEVRPAGTSTNPRQTPASALATLREAAESGTTVWIEFVDNDGSLHERVVDPQRVDGGWLRAFDHRSEDVRSFAVHRISAVRPVDHDRAPTP